MDLYILDRNFIKQDLIEEFSSIIWTERYYGDSECEVVVPLRRDLINKFATGTLLSIDQSDEPMIIETFNVEEGNIKVVGISITSWLNNRFVRNSVDQRTTKWKITNHKAGYILGLIVKQMCTEQSTILGTNTMGLGSAARENELAIPHLKIGHLDNSGKTIKKILVPFGPVYDALRVIAEQYKIGMQITLKESDRTLRFRSYKGVDRTSKHTDKPVRFSPLMDSLTNMNEVRSVVGFKTIVYSYASSLEKVDTADRDTDPDTWLQQNNKPGISRRTKGPEGKYVGFDLRAELLLCDDIKVPNDLAGVDDSIPDGTVAGKRQTVIDILNHRADKELKQNKFIRTVDGEVSPANLFKYGRDYNLGDIIEVQGNTKIVENSRVTEYIRSHDSQGEKAYPTVEAIDSE